MPGTRRLRLVPTVPRGNAVFDASRRHSGRGASGKAFPRGAWERVGSVLALSIAWAWLAPASAIAFEQGTPPTLAIPRPEARGRTPLPPRSQHAQASSDAGGGWWLGSAGIAAALAVFGGLSLASKRFLPSRDSGPIRVIGRSALSTKHSACLLRVGDRVLIVGIGPQGPPSTLGEVTDPLELARLVPPREARPTPEPRAVPPRPSAGFDRRIGDDE
jgi:flagellar biogenesis protein FliO